MALQYPVTLTLDDNGTILASVLDIPGVHSFGNDANEALENVADALALIIECRMRDGQEIPGPSRAEGRPTVSAPPTAGSPVKATPHTGSKS